LDLRKKMRDRRLQLWLRLARRGNEDVFRRLYRELFNPVAGYIQFRVPHREDAEDITSKVFEKFLTGLGSYDPGRGSVMTWTLTVARHTIIDYYRKRGPALEAMEPLDSAGANRLADGRPGPLQAMISGEEIEHIRRVLARQPADIREMFSLRFDQGLSVKDVAGVMGVSVDAAKQRFARAFRKLKLELRAENKPRRGEKTCTATD
jgi:RNA polymerase sigma-70 factor (ECF subfamily)